VGSAVTGSSPGRPTSFVGSDEERDMRITVVGRGNVGGGLADRWERTGHQVTRLGREGGDVSDAEAILVAVPGGAIADALDKLPGLQGRTVIDATNLVGAGPPAGFPSNAEFVKSRTNGPTAKSFNINFAALYDRLSDARATPCNLWCGDDEAREVVERLNRDAGYEPVRVGSLDKAAAQENFIDIVFAIAQGGLGPFVYRMAPPEAL
jgi:8-hydroxy-5-deazaflavin:NADPH oxidoreductase